jgi:hypothetical protein
MNYVLRVTAGEYVDQTLATASWWDRYELTPGDYPISWTSIRGDMTDPTDHTRTYYGTATVGAVLTHEHRVNTLLWASSTQDAHPMRPQPIRVNMYRYLCTPGAVVLGGLGTVVEITSPGDGS